MSLQTNLQSPEPDPMPLDSSSAAVSLDQDWTVGAPSAARAALVNRTHRVVRERAVTLQARKRTVRSLYIPLAVSGGLLIVIVCAIWSVLDQYEITPNGLPDANQQLLVLMMWCLPISVALLVIVWFRRAGRPSEGAQ